MDPIPRTRAGRPVHDVALRGFSAASEAYERARPGYPPEIVARLAEDLGIGPDARVCDVGAGTGKLTRALMEIGAEVIAVEPLPAMRDTLRLTLPGATVFDGTAEATGLPDAHVDAVTCGQAFHWFATPTALAEFTRVLRPRGGLGLVWNVRDDTVPWLARVSELLEAHRDDAPTHKDGTWREVVDADPRFEPVGDLAHPWVQYLDTESAVARFASVSFVAVMAESERAALLAQIAEVVDEVADPAAVVAIPHVTRLFTFRKVNQG